MSFSLLGIIGIGALGLIALFFLILPVAEMLSYRGEDETPKREITGFFSLLYWRLLPIALLLTLGIGFIFLMCFVVGILILLLIGLV